MLKAIYISWIVALVNAVPQSQSLPAKGDNGDLAGVFGIGASLISNMGNGFPIASLGAKGPEYPNGPMATINGGSGPYKASYKTDPGLASHTIYAPDVAPPVPMPVLVWGNGGCMNVGTAFQNLLTEIASHGYVVISNGKPGASGLGLNWSALGGGFSLNSLVNFLGVTAKVSQMTQAIDWVEKGGASRFGNIHKERIAAGGQSCGGLEALSASYHEPRVKLTLVCNVGIFDASRTNLLKELKAPVTYFQGGPVDPGTALSDRDYDLLPAGLPSVKVSLDTGHLGTYGAPAAGKFGKAIVAMLEWQFRNNATSKALFTDPKSPGSLVSERWNVTMKNIN